MEARRNPFTPEAGTPPPVLAGRASELGDFEDAILSLGAGDFAQSVVLTGLRGVGKTVLLGEYARLADENGWARGRLEAGENLSLPAEMAALAEKALTAFSRGEALGRGGRRARGALKSFRIRSVASGWKRTPRASAGSRSAVRASASSRLLITRYSNSRSE